MEKLIVAEAEELHKLLSCPAFPFSLPNQIGWSWKNHSELVESYKDDLQEKILSFFSQKEGCKCPIRLKKLLSEILMYEDELNTTFVDKVRNLI